MKKLFLFLLILFSLGSQIYAQSSDDELEFLDTSQSFEWRAKDLVKRLTTEEKLLQLFNDAPAIERLGIPAYNWWNESLHGVARAGKATVFPQAIGLAATWDEELMFRIATAISDEARAKHHDFVNQNVRTIYTGLTFWSPNINIFRDPRWGRGQETYGEDPYLTGRMAINFVKGMQGDDPKYLKTIATAKHYAVHSGPEDSRHRDNFLIDDRDLYETYLPAFEMVVKEADVQSVMCAYNRFRNKPCCGSDLLLRKILREKFGFSGYIVSDCGAISDFFEKGRHDFLEDAANSLGWSIASGTDLNCENRQYFIQKNFPDAIEKGIINIDDINNSVERLFTARFKLGLFDPSSQQSYSKIPISDVGSEEHLKLALQAAERSLVLLKNEGILPLKGRPKVALLGPNANNPDILIGNYNGIPIDPVTPLKALRKKLGIDNVLYCQATPLVPGIYGDLNPIPAKNLFHWENGEIKPGLNATYSIDKDSTKLSTVVKNIDLFWEKSPFDRYLDEPFTLQWNGVLIPDESGEFLFGGNVSLTIDGHELADHRIFLDAGKRYEIKANLALEKNWWSNVLSPHAVLSWINISSDLESQALKMAESAEVIIFCGGISPRLEGEEMPLSIDGFSHGDRTNIELPGVQARFLKKLHAIGKSLIYVNFSGSAIALNWEADNIPAIVQGFYPGEKTGTALVNILFGTTNPSGRLPVTFYRSVEDLPPFLDYHMEGRTYKYFEGEPLFTFGHGLSYTDFAYSDLSFQSLAEPGDIIEVQVRIKNKGKFTGSEIAQLYIQGEGGNIPVPLQKLVGFKRLTLKPGESKRVKFIITPQQLSIIDEDFNRIIKPGKIRIFAGGGMPGSQFLKSENKISGMLNLVGNPIQLQ